MKLTKITIILIGFLALFSACSYEDEIQIDPGKLLVYNNSNSSYDMIIKNMDMDEGTETIEKSIDANSTLYIPLPKGYNYEVNAVEVNTGQPELNIYSTTVTITAHQDGEWYIPTD